MRTTTPTTFDPEDLYKFNQLIHKLDDAGYNGAAEVMRRVRNAHFDDDGEPNSLNLNDFYNG